VSPGAEQSRGTVAAFLLLVATGAALLVLKWAEPEPHVVDDLFSPQVLNPREHN